MNRPVGIRLHLRELDARLLRRIDEAGDVSYVDAASLETAHGLNFLCPKCFHANKGKVGTHRVTCWFEGRVPDDANPGPGRWTPAGTGIDDLSFIPSQSQLKVSVVLNGGCKWHGFIAQGCATVQT